MYDRQLLHERWRLRFGEMMLASIIDDKVGMVPVITYRGRLMSGQSSISPGIKSSIEDINHRFTTFQVVLVGYVPFCGNTSNTDGKFPSYTITIETLAIC